MPYIVSELNGRGNTIAPFFLLSSNGYMKARKPEIIYGKCYYMAIYLCSKIKKKENGQQM